MNNPDFKPVEFDGFKKQAGLNSNFEAVIEKAKMACFNSGHRIKDHFADVSKMVEIGRGATREIKVTLLSRYAHTERNRE